nr:MAG TPA: hypothetical protein [Caudoviricetes sp.]
MKYKITARAKIYTKADFREYVPMCTQYGDFAEVECGEIQTAEEAENKLSQYHSLICVNDNFVFVTEYILDSKVHDSTVAPLSSESMEILRLLGASIWKFK